ncbi:MAG: 4Fe-4S binding protein [Candidatus Desantisbacteria bacterium]
MAYIITDECVACGTCLEACPNNAIEEGEDKYKITDECLECGDCVESCPVGAIIEE